MTAMECVDNHNFYSHASREARPLCFGEMLAIGNFYSHASREARLRNHIGLLLHLEISTHTPLARRDCISEISIIAFDEFLLTRLSRGATCPTMMRQPVLSISTHTPLARRDAISWTGNVTKLISTHTPLARRDVIQAAGMPKINDFYSHASREARRAAGVSYQPERRFLLTRLSRGATVIIHPVFL